MTNYYDEDTQLHIGASKPNTDESEGHSWKKVTVGSVAGILMGGGVAFDTHLYHTQEAEVVRPIESTTDDKESVGYHTIANGLRVAEVSEDMDFQEAFHTARGVVGAGGVFHWHGGVYNTYTIEEWSTMSESERSVFAQQVQPEVSVSQMEVNQAPAYVMAVVSEDSISNSYEEIPVVSLPHNDTSIHETPIIVGEEYVVTEIDDHMVAVRPLLYEGHVGAEIDLDLDGNADLAFVDTNDNGILDQDDYVVFNDDMVGSYHNGIGMEEYIPQPDMSITDYYIAQNDIAPDMPDYYNDADVSGIA